MSAPLRLVKPASPSHDKATLDAIENPCRSGFSLIWLHPRSKRPAGGNEWSTQPVASLDDLRRTHRHEANLGTRLGRPSQLTDGTFVHVLDVDIRIPDLADEAWARLADLFPGIDLTTFPTVQSGSGGESRHIYIATSQPLYGRKLAVSEGKHRRVVDGKDVWSYDWEIELFGTGKQVAMPPSIHPDTGKPYVWLVPFDLDALSYGINPAYLPMSALEAIGTVETATYAFEAREPLTFEPGQLERDLDAIPVSRIDSRDDWIMLGQALHHQFGGSDGGFELWMKHSARGSKFLVGSSRAKELRRYRGFGRNRRQPVTMGTIRVWAAEARAASLMDQFDEEPLPAPVDEFEAMLGGIDGDEFKDALSLPAVPPVIERLNREICMVRPGGRALIARRESDGGVSLSTVTDLKAWYANDRVEVEANKTASVADLWLKSPFRRQRSNVVFAPGEDPPDSLNLWAGWAVEPNASASCKLFLDHAKRIVCKNDQPSFNYLIGWLAHMIQRPAEKPGVALILQGKKGAGKDTLADYMRRVIGRRHAPTIADKRHLTGNFNARLEAALLLHVQEGVWGGDHDAERVLKYLVTSDYVEIERKGIDSFQVKSALRIFISANADWVVPASEDERRWAVFEVSDRRLGDAAYFDALRAEMDGEGPSALLHYLQSYDLTGFDVRRAPKTSGLSKQKIESLRDVAAWWFDQLTRGEIETGSLTPGDWTAGSLTVMRDAIRNSYVAWVKAGRFRGDPVNEAHFGRQIRELLPAISEHRPSVAGERRWSYRLPQLSECRDAFESFIGGQVEWGQ